MSMFRERQESLVATASSTVRNTFSPLPKAEEIINNARTDFIVKLGCVRGQQRVVKVFGKREY
eukprot:7009298-Ditylum_brightwellii.AAC.1